MLSIRHILYSIVLLTLLFAVARSASLHCRTPHDAVTSLPEEQQRFRELLNTVEPSSLHDILHKHLKEKFRHGIFQGDKAALEAVHLADKEVAHSLVELARRQAVPTSNGTIVTTALTIATLDITTTVPATSTQLTTIETPPPASTESSSSSAILDPPSSTSTPPPPPPSPPPPTGEPSTASTAPSPPPPDSGFTTSVSASSTDVSASSTSLPASVTSPQTISLPSTPPSMLTTRIVYETTLANGQETTITAITVVPANQVSQTMSAPSKTASGTASLQTNSARGQRIRGANVVLAVVGIAVVGVM